MVIISLVSFNEENNELCIELWHKERKITLHVDKDEFNFLRADGINDITDITYDKLISIETLSNIYWLMNR